MVIYAYNAPVFRQYLGCFAANNYLSQIEPTANYPTEPTFTEPKSIMPNHKSALLPCDLPAFISDYEQALIAMAKLAGQAIMDIYNDKQADSALETTYKSDNSPLTQADLAAHNIIVNHLSSLTPTIPVASEEDEASLAHRNHHGTFWLIDPLDGTKEFIARNGEFTVNIALVVEGKAGWGVVHAPALDTTYWGGPGFGAFKQFTDSAPHALSTNATSNDSSRLIRVVASKSHLNAETAVFIELLGKVDLVQAGSSLKFCKLADGGADIYPRLAPTCEWDTAAAQAILEGAGGAVFEVNGNRLDYGKPSVLNPSFIATATSELKARVLALLGAQDV